LSLLLIGVLVACAPTASPVLQDDPTPTPAAEDGDDGTSEEEPSDEETSDEEAGDEEDATDEEPADEEEDGIVFINEEEGGPVSIIGQVAYTNPFFTAGTAQPLVILEDQAGFVDRNENFLMPLASQTLGQITSNFFESPFDYSLALPIEPQGSYRDVDNDEEEEQGVQIFAVAYWTNTFGDPFLEERDLGGGGWSTAYASTRISEDFETDKEIIGGKLLVYAADETQSFPTDFGEDGLLFTEDDVNMVDLPQGYTVVDLDTTPFTFDRSANQVIDLIEPEGAALIDYSDLSYTEAFDSFIETLSTEYAFTEYKEIDWDDLVERYRPLFEEAEENEDAEAYRIALRDMLWEIPDGHVSGPFVVEEFQQNVSGGIGLAIRDVDDGRVIVNFVLEGAPAAEAGIELGAEIIAINETPIGEWIDAAVAYSAPFSTDHVERLQKLRYAIRFPIGEEVEVTFLNPDAEEDEEPETVTLEAIGEGASFSFSSFAAGTDGFELPVEYEVLDSGYVLVRITSFFDNEVLTIQL
ncbi:MAG: PDZ domain-containing protein, partial [Anaerolineales bacterium]|nr:PDZ domain-containing protein [Anaerolineales bacterium]